MTSVEEYGERWPKPASTSIVNALSCASLTVPQGASSWDPGDDSVDRLV